MPERSAFLAAIESSPDDDAPRLVYSDWLEENGEDAAAESIRLRVKLNNVGRHGTSNLIDIRREKKRIILEIEAADSKMSPLSRVTDPDFGDWQQAFAYAGGVGYGSADVIRAAPHIDVSEAPFGRIQVVEVIACREGENDGANWVCVGRLEDGRWFALEAGCDYTGWD